MKKLMIIAIAVLTISAASAQSRHNNDRMQDRNQATQARDDWHNKDQRQSKDYGYDKNNGYNNNNRNDDRKRQADYDRMNQQYDRQINDYRNDRSLNRYERERRIREAEQQRQVKTKAFGTGLVVGGVAGLILGAVLAH